MLFIRFAVSDQRCCAPLSPTRVGQWWPSLGAWPLSRTPLAHTYRQEEAAVESRSACAEPALSSPVDDSLDDIDPGFAASFRSRPNERAEECERNRPLPYRGLFLLARAVPVVPPRHGRRWQESWRGPLPPGFPRWFCSTRPALSLCTSAATFCSIESQCRVIS